MLDFEAVELLKQCQRTVLRPSETIDYLKQLQQRTNAEDTYLKL